MPIGDHNDLIPVNLVAPMKCFPSVFYAMASSDALNIHYCDLSGLKKVNINFMITWTCVSEAANLRNNSSKKITKYKPVMVFQHVWAQFSEWQLGDHTLIFKRSLQRGQINGNWDASCIRNRVQYGSPKDLHSRIWLYILYMVCDIIFPIRKRFMTFAKMSFTNLLWVSYRITCAKLS